MALATNKKAEDLKNKVDLVMNEFDMAITFHEVWKPMEDDKNLHQRMGKSHATKTFNIINVALRREMLMALMRIWDTQSRALGLKSIAEDLRNPESIRELYEGRFNDSLMQQELFKTWSERREQVIKLIEEKYLDGGVGLSTRKNLEKLRNKILAHRQVEDVTTLSISATEIEAFYQDTSRIVELLLSVVKSTSYNTEDTAKIFRRSADCFWAGVRGERTEGHPNYRPPPLKIKK